MKWKRIIIGELSWVRLVRSVLLIYVLTTILTHFYAERLIFPYHQSSYDKSISGLKILIANDATKIATRFWKVTNEKALIFYFHGNYMDIGHMDETAELLNSHSYSVLAMDYRGYGLSQGVVKEANTYTDAQLVFDYVLEHGYKSQNIIILGHSVGTGIATELAKKNNTKALILISPFISTYRVITKYSVFLFDKFNNLAKIKEIKEPLFIVHGTNDKVIPAWHSEKLIQQHQGKHKRILIQGAGHNDIWDYEYNDFMDKFDDFLWK